MVHPRSSRSKMMGLSSFFAAAFALIALPATTEGQIYVADGDSNGNGTFVREFGLSGAPIKDPLVSYPASSSPYPRGVAVSDGNLFVSNSGLGTISKYDAITGATINASFVSGLHAPNGIAVYQGKLFVVSTPDNLIGVYDATTGAALNAHFVTSGLFGPYDIAVSGGHLFVTNGTQGNGNTYVGEYDATTGAALNTHLITGLKNPLGIAVDGNYLYVVNYDPKQSHNSTVGEYDATTGAAVNAALVSGLDQPWGIAVFGGNLFITNSGALNTGWIDEYNATTGAILNAQLITHVSDPIGIDVVPEPASAMLLALGAALIFARLKCRRM
jgi:WD40 repeat protein